MVGLITDNDDTAYREEVRDLIVCYKDLSLNVIKTKEMTLDYIDRAAVEQVENFKFPGVQINNKQSWSKHTKTVVKRAQQSL